MSPFEESLVGELNGLMVEPRPYSQSNGLELV